MVWMECRLWVAKFQSKLASVTDQDSQLLEDIWAEEDHHQEEKELIVEDHTQIHQMESIEDVEDIPVKEKENTEIVIVIIKRAREEIGIVQDREKRNTEKEETVDQTLQENDLQPDLYTIINQWGRFKKRKFKHFLQLFKHQTILSTFQINQWIKFFNIDPKINLAFKTYDHVVKNEFWIIPVLFLENVYIDDSDYCKKKNVAFSI